MLDTVVLENMSKFLAHCSQNDPIKLVSTNQIAHSSQNGENKLASTSQNNVDSDQIASLDYKQGNGQDGVDLNICDNFVIMEKCTALTLA